MMICFSYLHYIKFGYTYLLMQILDIVRVAMTLHKKFKTIMKKQ